MNDRGPATFLEARDVTVRRGDTRAVDRVSFSVEEGTFFVLVGPSGCGKTSLLRAIAGFEVPVAGSISLAGKPLSGPDTWLPPERRQIGMVFQDGALFPHLSVRGNVEYGLDGAGAAGRAAETLELVGLADRGERYPDELSGGERQRVALARALAPSPRLLLLDEPFANLDAGLRRHVREEVRAIIDRSRTTAILVTHDQEEAMSLADRMAVMDSGRLLQAGPPEAVYRKPASLEVARFLNGGQLFACHVEAGRVRSILGETESELVDGPAWLLVRPEQVCLLEAGEGVVRGTVRQRHFFGHDLIQVIELDSGERVEVRLMLGDDSPVGRRVGLRLASDRFAVFADQR